MTVAHAGRHITICEFQANGRLPVDPLNIARGMPATSSTSGWGGVASRAVDGNTNGAYGGGTCTHTQAGDPEWWQVDLGASYHVMDFSIYHRTDCCQDRLVGATITVSQTSNYTLGYDCFASTDGGNVAQPETGTCNGVVGRYVTVS